MSAYALKTIGILAMLIDHIAWAFLPLGSFLSQAMHFVGRLTAPIMCFFIAEGYRYTRDVKKYAMRLGIFVLISHIPFYYFQKGKLPLPMRLYPTSVMYPLLLGLLSIIAWESKKLTSHQKALVIAGLLAVSDLGDWGAFALGWVFIFGTVKDDLLKFKYFTLVGILAAISPILSTRGSVPIHHLSFQMGIFLAIPLLKTYNGELGGKKGSKWFFYFFYPAHLIILGLMKWTLVRTI